MQQIIFTRLNQNFKAYKLKSSKLLNAGILISIFFCLPIPFLFGQSQIKEINEKYFSYGSSVHYGALLGYKENDPVIIFTNPFSIDLSIRKLSTGQKRWERMYNYPSTCISLGYYNYGIPEEYGEAYSATASYDFNLLRSLRNNVWFTSGFGLVYSTHKYDEVTNPHNKAISTDFSYVLQAAIRYDYDLSEKVILNASFSFKHFSNATSGIPNNGMNFPLLGIGLTYLPNRPAVNYIKDTLKTFDKKGHFSFSSGLAIKKVLKIDDRHRIYTASFYYDKPITKYNSIMVGLDAFYNTSLHSEYIKIGQSYDEEEIDHRQVALTLGQELFIGRIGVLAQGGFFIYQPHKFESSFYQKYGIKYYISKDIFLGSIVKVYVGTADYMVWAVGVRF